MWETLLEVGIIILILVGIFYPSFKLNQFNTQKPEIKSTTTPPPPRQTPHVFNEWVSPRANVTLQDLNQLREYGGTITYIRLFSKEDFIKFVPSLAGTIPPETTTVIIAYNGFGEMIAIADTYDNFLQYVEANNYDVVSLH